MSAAHWVSVLACGAALSAGLVGWVRRKAVAGLRFDLAPPPVPASVLDAVREAERSWYAGRGRSRRMVEALQDVAANLVPDLVALADWSVGPYRVRPSTVAPLLPWAHASGHFALHGAPPPSTRAALAYFAIRRDAGAWQAAVVLEHLRLEHPHLRTLSWQAIAADPLQVALLYSGYMGAGGGWSEWRASTVPGNEALRRMRIDARSGGGSGTHGDS